MSQIWPLKSLGSSEKLVLLRLADFADADGKCWPSIRRVANECSLSDRQVRTIIGELAKNGYLQQERRPGKVANYTVTPAAGFSTEVVSVLKSATVQSCNGFSTSTEICDISPIPPYMDNHHLNHHQTTTGRASRLKADFQMPAKWAEWAKGKGLNDGQIKTQFDKIVRWSLSSPKGIKLDWFATWQNWIEKYLEDHPIKNSAAKPSVAQQMANAKGFGNASLFNS